MLDITENTIKGKVETDKLVSVDMVQPREHIYKIRRILWSVFFGFIAILFLPWTQNIRNSGKVTALRPDQRPTTIQSVIDGRIESWYVQEGDYVNVGDTIMFISEIRDEFFDPLIVPRMEGQIFNRQSSVQAMRDKIIALQDQTDALRKNNRLRIEQAKVKLTQTKLKVEADSMNLRAAEVNYAIAVEQFKRMEQLFNEGLRSLTEFETRKLQFEREQATLTFLQNTFLNSKNDLLNAVMEVDAIANDFQERLAKIESDRQSVESSLFETEASIINMQNRLSNISVRQSNYYITAPQSGYITQAIRAGIGENIREGTELVSIMPADAMLAVEMFIRPLDFPLVKPGVKVMFIFDGWPAIVFSGWPQLSNGTFPGRIFAVDNFAQPNGMYRALVVPDPNDTPWPEQLRIGSGAKGYTLLKDVPVWYELWRQINGFPPDFYTDKTPRNK
ncbi:MAG: HlyD family secretion protein [Luteibaculaceae bacterium]